MANFQLLNSETHKTLRVNTKFTEANGYKVGASMLLPAEIVTAQREYPILLRKHAETGRFFPNALFGFNEEENLFIDAGGDWNANYIPLSVAKGPFVIGFNKAAEGEEPVPIVYVDIEDPRVGPKEGELVFQENGELSEYMYRVTQVLLALHNDVASIESMIDAFTAAEIIEPVKIEVQFDNGENLNFAGAYTIDEEKLKALSESQLAELASKGYLGAAYYIAGSLGNIGKLVDLKNKQLSQSAVE